MFKKKLNKSTTKTKPTKSKMNKNNRSKSATISAKQQHKNNQEGNAKDELNVKPPAEEDKREIPEEKVSSTTAIPTTASNKSNKSGITLQYIQDVSPTLTEQVNAYLIENGIRVPSLSEVPASSTSASNAVIPSVVANGRAFHVNRSKGINSNFKNRLIKNKNSAATNNLLKQGHKRSFVLENRLRFQSPAKKGGGGATTENENSVLTGAAATLSSKSKQTSMLLIYSKEDITNLIF